MVTMSNSLTQRHRGQSLREVNQTRGAVEHLGHVVWGQRFASRSELADHPSMLVRFNFDHRAFYCSANHVLSFQPSMMYNNIKVMVYARSAGGNVRRREIYFSIFFVGKMPGGKSSYEKSRR